MTLARWTGAALALALAVAVGARAEEGGPKAFETPEALVDAMVEAAAKNDDAAIKALAGSEHADLVQSGGDPEVARSRAEFASRLGVALEEADESSLWFEIITEAAMNRSREAYRLLHESDELGAILAQSCITARATFTRAESP